MRIFQVKMVERHIFEAVFEAALFYFIIYVIIG